MGWKDWPYWLKGVIISAIITIIIVVIITSFYIIRDKDKPENQKGVFYLPDLIPSLIGIFLIILIILILIENFRKGRYSLFFAVLVGFLLSIVNIFVYGIIGIPFAMPLIVIFESLKICYGEECWGWGIIIGSLVYIISSLCTSFLSSNLSNFFLSIKLPIKTPKMISTHLPIIIPHPQHSSP